MATKPRGLCEDCGVVIYKFNINKNIGEKTMANENEQLNQTHKYGKDSFSFDDLEKTLESQLLNEFNDIDFLEDELDKIGDTDKLGEAIENVVWEQFINLIADKAGEDFIKENQGLLLDLRKSEHIQTLEAFKKGEFARFNR